MSYLVKEIFYTLQGEGAHAGRPAVFCRFSGCNLWSGHERDRSKAACTFCDTDFVGGTRYASADLLTAAISAQWPHHSERRFVVCTGGEPLLQLDGALVSALHCAGFQVAIETNGTLAVPDGVDWVCASPKGDVPLRVARGNELKLVFPQSGVDPARFEHLHFERFSIQPMDGPEIERNVKLSVRYCLEHPRWQLSVQWHKWLGLQ